MLAYKYSFDDVMEKPLISAPMPGGGKRGLLTTVVILPILLAIGIVLLLYSPVKMIQLAVEKFQDRKFIPLQLNETE